MGNITAVLVKELRERTGAGMMDCKKALVKSEGDIELAIEDMRKSGQAKAVKKAGRVAAEGIIAIKSEGKKAIVVEINSETDFVARDANFLAFANKIVDVLFNNDIADIEALSAHTVDGVSVEELRHQLIAKIGENINLRRFEIIKSDNILGSYVHGGKIGVVVELEGGDEQLAKDMAMQVTASNPVVITPEELPAELIAKEKDIFIAQAQASGKPMEIIEKMIQGRLRKFQDEVSLVGQPFVKDPNMKVGQLLKNANAKVLRFVRFAVGEGIEKQESDFAKEVMEQAGV